MKEVFYIKDLDSDKFFWTGKVDEGFTKELAFATIFSSYEEAQNLFKEPYFLEEEVFKGRTLQIQKAVKFD